MVLKIAFYFENVLQMLSYDLDFFFRVDQIKICKFDFGKFEDKKQFHDKGKDQSGLNWIKFDNNHYSNKNRIRY